MAAMMSACLAINRDRSTAEESSKNKNKKIKFHLYRKALNLPIFDGGGLLVSWRIYDYSVQTVNLAIPPN